MNRYLINVASLQNVTVSTKHDNSTFLDKNEATPHNSKRYLFGPIFSSLGIIIIVVLYLLAVRKESRESKEKAIQAKRKVEMKRKFMKDHMHIRVYAVESSSCIVDIESQQRKADEHSTISTTDVSQEEQWNDDSAMVQSNNSITKMQPKDVICPICHEQFEYGDTLATSRNNYCCHTAFHSDCIISWLMTDHKDCPICRSMFIVDNSEEDEDEVPA